jgi:hypothetical protein
LLISSSDLLCTWYRPYRHEMVRTHVRNGRQQSIRVIELRYSWRQFTSRQGIAALMVRSSMSWTQGHAVSTRSSSASVKVAMEDVKIIQDIEILSSILYITLYSQLPLSCLFHLF